MHYFGIGNAMGIPMMSGPVFGIGLILLLAWSLVWKGLALWRAAKRSDTVWFIVFLIVNTAGILEIIYLFFVTGAKISDFTVSPHEHKHHDN